MGFLLQDHMTKPTTELLCFILARSSLETLNRSPVKPHHSLSGCGRETLGGPHLEVPSMSFLLVSFRSPSKSEAHLLQRTCLIRIGNFPFFFFCLVLSFVSYGTSLYKMAAIGECWFRFQFLVCLETKSHDTVQAGFKPVVLLPQPQKCKCRDDRTHHHI